MKSKLKNLLFLFFLVLLAVFVIAQATTLIKTGSIVAIQNSSDVKVPVSLENDDFIAGFQFEIDYDSSLTFKDFELTSRTSNASIEVNDTGELLRIAGLVEELIAPGNGTIMNLIFDVDAEAPPSDTPVDISELLVGDINTTPIPTDVVNGTFSIVLPYNFSFLPPISLLENFTLQDGATLPLKFNVSDENDFVVDNTVKVKIFNSTGFEQDYNASGEGDNFIRINETDQLYIVNIHTNQLEMAVGDYDIDVTFSNFQEEMIGFELIQQGKGRGKKK